MALEGIYGKKLSQIFFFFKSTQIQNTVFASKNYLCKFKTLCLTLKTIYGIPDAL